MGTDVDETGDRESGVIELTLSLEVSGNLWVARGEVTDTTTFVGLVLLPLFPQEVLNVEVAEWIVV